MSTFRLFSLPTHAVLEMIAGLALMVAPFLLGFGPAGTIVAVTIGTLLVGFAVGGGEGISIAAHVAFDQLLVTVLLLSAVGLALAGDRAAALVFLAAGIMQLTLTATTRYTRPLGPHAH